MLRVLVGVILAFVAIIAMLAALGWFILRSISLDDIVNIPLTNLKLEGTMPLGIQHEFDFDPATLELVTNTVLHLDVDDVNTLLPTKDYSLLVQELDSPTVASLLGRLQFVPDSALVAGADGNITIGAGIAGEFYVRERRAYERDEEQPGAGAELPFAGTAILTLERIRFDPSWRLLTGARIVDIRLDAATRESWRGRYGGGDYLVELVEAILNQRAKELLAALDTEGFGMRERIEELVNRYLTESLGENAVIFSIERIEVDNCPAVDQAGTVSLAFASLTRATETESERLILPNLTIRDGPCPS